MKKVSILIILVLLFMIYDTSAHAIGGVEIVGTGIMNQNVFGQITLIGADTMGLTGPIKEAAAAASYNDPIKWVIDGVSQWLLLQKLQWGTALSIASNGAKYLKDGRILLNGELSDFLTDFYNWIWDGESGPNIKQYAEVIESGSGTVEMENVDTNKLFHPEYTYTVNFGTMLHVKYVYNPKEYIIVPSEGSNVVMAARGGGDSVVYPVFFARESGQKISYTEIINGSSTSGTETLSQKLTAKDGSVYYYKDWVSQYELEKGETLAVTSGNNFVWNNQVAADVAYLIFGSGAAIGDDTILGDPNRLGGLTGDQDINILAPPDLFDWSSPDFNIPGDADANIDINNYLDALQEGILEGEGNVDIQITQGDGTTIDQTESFTYDQTQDISVEQTATDTIDQPITSVAPVTEVSDLAPFTMDLRNYFPFCIPWDIYNMITILVADPEAPKIDYPFVIPNIVDYTIELDFSSFDSVAQVLRTMELLAAAVGLAFVTKRLIQGGD